MVGFFSGSLKGLGKARGIWERKKLGCFWFNVTVPSRAVALQKALWRGWRGLGGPEVQVRWGCRGPRLPCPEPCLLQGPWFLPVTAPFFGTPSTEPLKAPCGLAWPHLRSAWSQATSSYGGCIRAEGPPWGWCPQAASRAEGVSLAQTLWTGALATCRSGSCGQSTSTGCPPWARPSRSWGVKSCVPCRRSSSASARPWAGTCCTPTWTSGNQVGQAWVECPTPHPPLRAPSQGHQGEQLGQHACLEATLHWVGSPLSQSGFCSESQPQ